MPIGSLQMLSLSLSKTLKPGEQQGKEQWDSFPQHAA